MSPRISICLLHCYSQKSFNAFRKFKPTSLVSPYAMYPALNPSSYSRSMSTLKKFKPAIDEQIEDILTSVDKKSKTSDNIVSVLKSLRLQILFQKIDGKTFIYDPRFSTLCSSFASRCNEIEPSQLISGLRSLLELGLSPNSESVVAAERAVLRNLIHCSVFDLIVCLYFHCKFTSTDLQKQVLSEVVRAISDRISEVSTSSEVTLLTSTLTLFLPKERKNIERKIIELLPTLSRRELCKLITTLSEKSNRNVAILNVATLHIKQNADALSFKEIIGLLYAFKKLNFCDPLCFSRLISCVLPEIQYIEQPSSISAFLSVCGHLRWRSPDLLSACGSWIEKNFHLCRTREFVSYILATAALNYSTPHTKDLMKQIIPHVSVNSVKDPEVLLDVAWSLAVLEDVPKQLLTTVLSPSFYQALIDEEDLKVSSSNELKLLNLKGILRLEHPECVFATGLYLEPKKLPENTDIENSRNHVINVLSNFVPRDKYLCVNQVNDMGIFIDAEFIMDKNGRPMPLKDYDVAGKIKSSTKPLPKEARRICLLIMFHKDYTMDTTALTGLNSLAKKLLSQFGYEVAVIPYEEFSTNKTEVRKAKYLQKQISNAMKNE